MLQSSASAPTLNPPDWTYVRDKVPCHLSKVSQTFDIATTRRRGCCWDLMPDEKEMEIEKGMGFNTEDRHYKVEKELHHHHHNHWLLDARLVPPCYGRVVMMEPPFCNCYVNYLFLSLYQRRGLRPLWTDEWINSGHLIDQLEWS